MRSTEQAGPFVTASDLVTVRRRRFGQTDLIVSEFGLGCARLGGIFQRDPAEFVNLLSAALDGGINLFDTSNIYSQGESERLIGRAFRRRRDEVVIATKAGYVLPSQRQMIARIKPLVRPLIRMLGLTRAQLPQAVRGSLSQDFSAAHLRASVEASLRRLGTDRIDLFQLHSPSRAAVDAGDWIEALDRLKRDGKIRYYGVSCDTAVPALAALDRSAVSSVQVPISLLDQGNAGAVVPAARLRGVAVIAREVLANGLLVKEGDVDVRSYCQSDEEAVRKTAELASLQRHARERGVPLARLALEWVSALDGVTVSLIGVSRLEQLRALLTTGVPPRRD
jgi:aryl-alcohol dehydrogenase-like predicted oxidoreductase